MARRYEIRFGPATLVASAGGICIGAGVVALRTGIALESLGWIPRLFSPSGKPAVLQGAFLITAGLLLVLFSALQRRGRRR